MIGYVLPWIGWAVVGYWASLSGEIPNMGLLIIGIVLVDTLSWIGARVSRR